MMIDSWSNCQRLQSEWPKKFFKRTQFFATILHNSARWVWTRLVRWPMIYCPNLFRACVASVSEQKWRTKLNWNAVKDIIFYIIIFIHRSDKHFWELLLVCWRELIIDTGKWWRLAIIWCRHTKVWTHVRPFYRQVDLWSVVSQSRWVRNTLLNLKNLLWV